MAYIAVDLFAKTWMSRLNLRRSIVGKLSDILTKTWAMPFPRDPTPRILSSLTILWYLVLVLKYISYSYSILYWVRGRVVLAETPTLLLNLATSPLAVSLNCWWLEEPIHPNGLKWIKWAARKPTMLANMANTSRQEAVYWEVQSFEAGLPKAVLKPWLLWLGDVVVQTCWNQFSQNKP